MNIKIPAHTLYLYEVFRDRAPTRRFSPASFIRLVISVVLWQEPVDIAGCAVALRH